ncbi:hypothetical protein ES703_63427 [subsurface metagenome]
MVLGDDIYHFGGQVQFFGFLNTHFYMRFDNSHRETGFQPIMLVIRSLVFNKILGLVDFANIMIIGADPGQQGVGIDCTAGGFSQVGYTDRVAVGARRQGQHPF